MQNFSCFILFLSIYFSLFSCKSDDEYISLTDRPYTIEIPSNFPEVKQDLKLSPPTELGIQLGRKLFYDTRLSRNNTISCAFCHEQSSAFTHHGHDLSHGIDNLVGLRNTPAIQNVIFQSQFFFDGAASTIQMIPIPPIHNPVEMDENIPNILEKLKQDPQYVRLFEAAFENKKINSANMLSALAQFMATMISANSKYDKYRRNETGGNLSEQELYGLTVFRNKCATCHSSDIFTDNQFRNNGLPPNPKINDLGREQVTGFEQDRYKFKVPSLRNIELTAPYMHDGRFGSLESVLNFYSNGVQNTQNLDPLMIQTDGRLGINLTTEEKQALIAFLKTLTDYQYINNPSFNQPT